MRELGSPETSSPARRRVTVTGVVQGVGFRPHAYSVARALGLTGSVWNSGVGVVAEVEGSSSRVEEFCRRIRDDAPPLAVVATVEWEAVALEHDETFAITPSTQSAGRTLVSPDVSSCDDCVRELTDPADRRFRHPFITCTNCGPRFTITTGLPYDRPATTMAGFAMCADCASEYDDPADRRFHAQTICCHACGPRLALVGPHRVPSYDESALAEAQRLLADGAIVAVKGIGGYHLACDATNEDAVATLRKRKQRGDKPFAVLVRTPADVRRLVVLDDLEEELITSRTRPIVLCAARPGCVAPSVAPGNADLGVMLASTPLHHLLLEGPTSTLVMTSGNLAGEPIVTDDEEAIERLGELADAWLTADRPIHVPCDDTVTRAIAGAEAPIRRSRGQAPLPVTLPFDCPPVLGVGGDVKNTFCLAEGRTAWMSAHVGDMDDLRTQDAFDRAEQHLELLTGVQPTALVADAHPAYRTRRWALEHAAGRRVHLVQHHHAHVASTMAEHGLTDQRVIGIAFDGTGYGDDGASWGGEVLVADYRSYERAWHLAYVDLPGGDAGVRNPCRMALSHLRSAGVAWDPALPCVRACSDEELGLLSRQLETRVRCVPTSSMGRLFDAVASIAGICHRIGYDAQAAMELEARARGVGPVEGYRFDLDDGIADAAPVVRAAAADVLAGVEPGVVAARFQGGVVELVNRAALHVRDATGLDLVTLSGGVFLNAALTEGCATDLAGHGFTVLRHQHVPCSDAGIALGQVALLAHTQTP